MNWAARFAKSSVGAKALMATTGAALVGFTLIHMIGNLAVFAGPDALNSYAEKLKSMAPLLWVMRVGLFGIAAVHVATGLRLTVANRAARPEPYHVRTWDASSFSSRTMPISGGLLLVFIVYHLLHYTLGVVQPATFAVASEAARADVYAMVVAGFSNPAISVSYILAMLALGAHLAHGIKSLFQSLGLRHPKYAPTLDIVGPAAAAILVLGNISMPVAILAGLVKGV